MFYTIYKITNKNSGKIYIGQHATKKLDDGYYGSGTRITEAIANEGRESFSKEIIHIFTSKEEMIQKEKEIVDIEFISREDTYNIIPGGGFNASNTMVVRKIHGLKFFRIPSCEYDDSIYTTATSNTLLIIEKDELIRINSCDYDSKIHKTPSTGFVSIYYLNTGRSGRVSLLDFDETKHKKVLGGIVAWKDGKKQYVAKDEFETNSYNHIHKGKVTVFDKTDGIRKHITKTQYELYPDKYVHNTAGFVTGRDSLGNKIRVETGESNNRTDLTFSTKGQRTVFDINENKFINIMIDDYNKSIHKTSQNKMFICYDSRDNLLFKYWGSKKDFFEQYKFPGRVWDCICSDGMFISKDEKYSFTNCYFRLIDWTKLSNPLYSFSEEY